MSSVIKFIPILDDEVSGAVCYLLQLDEINILLDCGAVTEWTEEIFQRIESYCTTIDLLLLSHSDMLHMGAFIDVYLRYKENIKIYSTIPIQNLGKVSILDYKNQKFSQKSNLEQINFTKEQFPFWSNKIIFEATEAINTLRYSQPTRLSGKCSGVSITAYGAGHSIGGAVWQITNATDVIVYAPDFNHRKERHLNGTVLLTNGAILDSLYRPSLFISGANSSHPILSSRKNIEQQLLTNIRDILNKKGTVLIPTDSSSRVLELIYLLEQLFIENDLHSPIIFLNSCASTTLKYAMSILEWMGGNIVEQFGITRENPFDFRKSNTIKIVHKIEEANTFNEPKVILASLDFFNELFNQLANDPINSIIITDHALPNSLVKELHQLIKNKGQQITSDVVIYQNVNEFLDIKINKKVLLEGSELAIFRQFKEQRIQKEAEAAAILSRNKHLMEKDDSDDDSDNDDLELDLKELLSRQYDIYVKENSKLIQGYFKSGSNHRMYPYIEKKRKFDDYGEEIIKENYLTKLEQLNLKKEKYQNNSLIEESENVIEDINNIKFIVNPIKIITTQIRYNIKCQLNYIAIEGKSDTKSVRNILKIMNPRKLVLINGNKNTINELKQTFIKDKMDANAQVFAPHIGECLMLGSSNKTLDLKLSDELIRSIKFYKYQDFEVGKIQGIIQVLKNETSSNLLLNKNEDAISTKPIMIGDIKFTELRTVFHSNGFITEFLNDGSLKVNQNLIIKKDSNGNIRLDGKLCKDYYLVRSILYNALAVL
ncbi:hypothetical protein K502DRAFT_316976 [Neoconidiobolus thromboides FSU 785]|nr:hypothetical protein K502DRAFT_316976 [Neoconidiobolus thromboides FSU 785]